MTALSSYKLRLEGCWEGGDGIYVRNVVGEVSCSPVAAVVVEDDAAVAAAEVYDLAAGTAVVEGIAAAEEGVTEVGGPFLVGLAEPVSHCGTGDIG